MTSSNSTPMEHVPIDYILPPARPRPTKLSQAMLNLAIQKGIVPPVLLTKIDDRKYRILCDGTGWWIAQQTSIPEVPAHVVDLSEINDTACRKEGDEIETARQWKQIYDTEKVLAPRGALTRAAKSIGISKTTLHRWLKLLDLDNEIQQRVIEGKLSASKAILLEQVTPEDRAQVARHIEKLSLGKSKLYVDEMSCKRRNNTIIDKIYELFEHESEHNDIRSLEVEMAEITGSAVRLMMGRDGRGIMIFQYYSMEELQGLLERMGYNTEK